MLKGNLLIEVPLSFTLESIRNNRGSDSCITSDVTSVATITSKASGSSSSSNNTIRTATIIKFNNSGSKSNS